MGTTDTRYEVRWKNYKCFNDTGWISLKPITIFIGPNNAGKSALLSPLLLLSQTLSSTDTRTPLVTKGELVDAGGFGDMVRGADQKRLIYFGMRKEYTGKGSGKPIGKLAPSMLELDFKGSPSNNSFSLDRFRVKDRSGRLFLDRKKNASGFYSYRTAWDIIKPSNFNKGEYRTVRRSQPQNFLFSPANILYHFQDIGQVDEDGQDGPFSTAFGNFLNVLGYSFTEIRRTIGNIRYLGPLRAKPRRFYEKLGQYPEGVGPRGEFAPHVFEKMSRRDQSAIGEWVSRFNIGRRVDVREVGGLDIFQLNFKDDSNVTSNFYEMGFGASQVFPLITEVLSSDPGSMLITEQPEIHLNPKLQSRLAELFVESANIGRINIIETHSEHLVITIRRLIAEGKIDSSDVALYFVEKNEGESAVRKMRVSQWGDIAKADWPDGFFQDGLREAMALTSAQIKRKMEG